jgi:chloramphenicol-sensitive protein RarD
LNKSPTPLLAASLTQPIAQNRIGLLYAILAYSAWGLFPIYWKFFGTIPATEVLSHRMIWSNGFLLGLLLFQGRLTEFFKQFYTPRSWLPLLGTSSILAINWGLYIYGVNSDRVIETSLGYFITPLINVLLGVAILKEKLTWGHWTAVLLATVGVLNSAVTFGHIPWLALSLAFSFGSYGLFRKIIPVNPLTGLTVETVLLTPVAIAYLGYLSAQHTNHFGQSIPLTLLFMGCGVVTALPLLWFNNAVQRLPLSTLGFFQYLAPTLQLLLGIAIYHEPFTLSHGISFSFIWAALALYLRLVTHPRP